MCTTVRWPVVTFRRELQDLDEHAARQRTFSAQATTCQDGPRCGLLGASTRRRWRLGHADQGEEDLKTSAQHIVGRERILEKAIRHVTSTINIMDIICAMCIMGIIDIVSIMVIKVIIRIMGIMDIMDIMRIIRTMDITP